MAAIRVANAFDAMTNRRPYRAPRTVDDALEELWRCRGRQFDPELVGDNDPARPVRRPVRPAARRAARAPKPEAR